MSSAIRNLASRRGVVLAAAVALSATLLAGSAIRTGDAAEPGVEVVYIAQAEVFADALAGSVISASHNAPLLFVSGTDFADTIPEATIAELERLEPQSITILGGSAAVSEQVESTLDGYTDGPVERLSGIDRYGTAVDISQMLPDKVSNADQLDGMDSTEFLAADETAADSDLLDGMDSTEFALAGDDTHTTVYETMAFGDEVVLASHGPLAYVAECTSAGGTDSIRIYATSSQDGTWFPWETTTAPQSAGFESDIATISDTTGESTLSWQIDGSALFGPDGHYLAMQHETSHYGVNVFGSDCLFAGNFFVTTG